MVGAVLLAAAFAAVAAAAHGAGDRATIRLVDEQPVAVAGRGFAPRERVTVRVVPLEQQRYSKEVRATRTGRFTVVFRTETLDECTGYTITAHGARSSRATIRRLIPTPCGIVIQP